MQKVWAAAMFNLWRAMDLIHNLLKLAIISKSISWRVAGKALYWRAKVCCSRWQKAQQWVDCVGMSCSQWRRRWWTVDDAWDVLLTANGGPGSGGGVKSEGGSGVRRLRRTKLVRSYLESRPCLASPPPPKKEIPQVILFPLSATKVFPKWTSSPCGQRLCLLCKLRSMCLSSTSLIQLLF
jgi:hypothetical protein